MLRRSPRLYGRRDEYHSLVVCPRKSRKRWKKKKADTSRKPTTHVSAMKAKAKARAETWPGTRRGDTVSQNTESNLHCLLNQTQEHNSPGSKRCHLCQESLCLCVQLLIPVAQCGGFTGHYDRSSLSNYF